MTGDADDADSAGRRDLICALAIGLTGLALRVVCARQYAADPLGQFLWIDEQAYWQRARSILTRQFVPDRPFYQDPLYPYLLAGLMVVVGDGVRALRIALAALGALTPVAVFWAGRKGLGRSEGLAAGWAAALYGPLVFTDTCLEKEGLGALLAAVALGLTAMAATGRRGPGSAAWAGLAWGTLALLRSNALVVGPIGTAWRVGAFPRPRWGPVLAFAAAFAVALAPAVVVNTVVSRPRELMLTTWQAGPNFYMGNGPEATGTMNDLPFVAAHPFFEADGYVLEARRRTGRNLSPGEVSRFWLREGLKRWREAPGASLRLLARKAFLLANDYEVADNHNWQYARLTAAPALGLGFLSFGWVAPWAAMGLAVGKPGRTPFWWFVVVSTAGGLAATAAFFVVGRYRIPWMPGLLLLASVGVVDAARRLAASRGREVFWRVALLALPAAALAWAPTPVPADDRWGLALRRQFKACLWAGEVDRAVDALDDARALGPVPMAHIALMLAIGPEHDRLEAAVESSRTLPDVARARLLRQVPGGRAESRRILESALRADPADRAARREWGAWWLGEVSGFDVRTKAARELRLAAAGPEGDASAALLLAILTADPRALELPAVRTLGRSPRLRVARAIVAEGPARTRTVNHQ